MDMNDTKPSSTWMQAILPQVGDKTLMDICITGSHDSGMSICKSQTLGANQCNTRTQTHDIAKQLEYGARYFDIRPVLGGDEFYTGHYTQVPLIGWQGARGISIADMITQVNAFTNRYAELVILNLSHAYDTNTGRTYEDFTVQQWQALLEQLASGLSHTLSFPSPVVNFCHKTLNSLIGGGESAVVVIVPDGVEHSSRGFLSASQFPVYNSYADTGELKAMAADQLKKMKKERDEGNYFLLSWTLTQSGRQAAMCSLHPNETKILSAATVANQALPKMLEMSIDPPTIIPNIIYTDNITDGSSAALATKINLMLIDEPRAAG